MNRKITIEHKPEPDDRYKRDYDIAIHDTSTVQHVRLTYEEAIDIAVQLDNLFDRL